MMIDWTEAIGKAGLIVLAVGFFLAMFGLLLMVMAWMLTDIW